MHTKASPRLLRQYKNAQVDGLPKWSTVISKLHSLFICTVTAGNLIVYVTWIHTTQWKIPQMQSSLRASNSCLAFSFFFFFFKVKHKGLLEIAILPKPLGRFRILCHFHLSILILKQYPLKLLCFNPEECKYWSNYEPYFPGAHI